MREGLGEWICTKAMAREIFERAKDHFKMPWGYLKDFSKDFM